MSYITSLTSTAFRVLIYIFLRVAPLSFGKTVVPSLFLSYVTSYIFSQSTRKHEPQQNGTPLGPAKSPQKRSWTPLTTILFTLPTTSTTLSRISLLINSVLVLLAVDFVSYPIRNPALDVTFARVGAVDPYSAKIGIRYPKFNTTIHSVKVVYRPIIAQAPSDEPWTDGPVLDLHEDYDWVNTTRLGGLWPSTTYEYRLTDTNDEVLAYPPTPLKLRTFPDPRLGTGSNFRFIVSSCIIPNFPYVPTHGDTIKGLDLLANYLFPPAPTPSAPISNSSLSNDTTERISDDNSTLITSPATVPTEFLLLLGDFIYADIPFYFGDDAEAYRRLYRRNYASPSFRKIYERLPVFHIYDDHEFINNYAGFSNDSAPFLNASSAFSLYNGQANYDPITEADHYYSFRYADVAFFVMDTRRYRSEVDGISPESRTILGERQYAAFHTWLAEVNQTATFKFVVTSVPFTSLWTHDAAQDSWAGFEHEKTSILTAMHTVPNVIVLSGDRHEFAAIEYTSPIPSSQNVIEFSTSPLSMFDVPFIRTLKNESEQRVRRVTKTSGLENGEEEVETVPQEKVLKYIPMGNSKWSAFEIDTTDPEKPQAHIEVMIDGLPAYRVSMTGVPVKLRTSAALGALLPQTLRKLIDKIGLKPSKWF